jgi:streptomycin 6-kinase
MLSDDRADYRTVAFREARQPLSRTGSRTQARMSNMAHLPLPTNLSDAAAGDDDADRRAWIACLPEIVADLADRWSLRLGEPYQPGGQCSWVAPAFRGADESLVLKVGWSHSEAANEADALRVWNGGGAVRLHASATFDHTSALLLERCSPGTPLGVVTPGPEQDLVVAGLLRRLWRTPAQAHPFRPLQVMCDEWADEFEEKNERTPVDLDIGLVREGITLFRTLPATAETDALLCTDLHGENILAAEREPWLVIDPKPYVGDPAYDSLQHMLNCEDRLVADPVGLARRMASLLDLDAERVTLWLFARCVQESIDWGVLRQVAHRIAPA